MDPNACYCEIVDAITERDYASAAALFKMLDEWLRIGGFLPDQWTPVFATIELTKESSMGKNAKDNDKVDDTIDVRRKLKEMGKEPVPEPSDKLKNKKWD